jgi:protein-S-isoprenylcysteine O-methyltransferase Ste14
MIWRAAIAILAFPGIVAFLVPWLIVESLVSGSSIDPLGAIPFGLGLFLLAWCVWCFLAYGRGTIAPWDPPRQLVVHGPYRYSRNPMYIGVVLILWGWALGYHSILLIGYAAAMMLVFHVRVVMGEEPWLERTHGESWQGYRRRVPRWIGPLARPARGAD